MATWTRLPCGWLSGPTSRSCLLSNVVVLVEKLELGALNEPLISLAICADELTTEPSASPSSAVILAAKLCETDVKEPLMSEDI